MKQINIEKYPLAKFLASHLFVEPSSSKSVSIYFDHRTITKLHNNASFSKDKKSNNHYINLLFSTSLINRKKIYTPKVNANFIKIIDDKKASYITYNDFKRRSYEINESLTIYIDKILHQIIIKHCDIYNENIKNFIKTLKFQKAINTINATYNINPLNSIMRSSYLSSLLSTNGKIKIIHSHENFIKFIINGKKIVINTKDDNPPLNNIRLSILSLIFNLNLNIFESRLSSRLSNSLNHMGIYETIMNHYQNDNHFKEFKYIYDNKYYISMLALAILKPKEAKVGKVLNKVFDKIKPNEIEGIINLFIGKIKLDTEITKNFKELRGDEIVEYYNKYKYLGYFKKIESRNELFSSCLRYVSCRDYLTLYKENPKVVKMLVLFDSVEINKIKGRCIIWNDKYYDRIYANSKNTFLIFKSYLESKEYLNINHNNGKLYTEANNLPVIKLDNWMFDRYPYMDSYCYLDQASGSLYNYSTNINKYNLNLISLKSHYTGVPNAFKSSEKKGEYINFFINSVYSKTLDTFIPKVKAFYIKTINDFDLISNFKNYSYCLIPGESKNVFKGYKLYPKSESVYVNSINCKTHISNTVYDESKNEFILK